MRIPLTAPGVWTTDAVPCPRLGEILGPESQRAKLAYPWVKQELRSVVLVTRRWIQDVCLGGTPCLAKIPSFYFEFSFLARSPSLHMTINTGMYLYMIKPKITPSPIHLFILEEEVRNFHSALSVM